MDSNSIGRQAQDDFEKALKLQGKGVWWYRIPDTTDIRRKAGVKSFASLPRGPADFIVCDYLGIHLAEVKGTVNQEKFSLENIEALQQGACSRIFNLCGESYFFYLRSFYTNRWFKITPGFVLNAFEKNQKAIYFKDLERFTWKI